MFFEELIQHLTDNGYSYSLDYYDDDEEKDMIYIEHDGDIILPIESLSGNICFSNHGKVELPNLKTTYLCSNIWFENKGKVFYLNFKSCKVILLSSIIWAMLTCQN